MLAGGGESCADIEHLRLQEDLFGSVPSDTTVFRTFHEITPSTRSGIACAMAEVRARSGVAAPPTTGSAPVLLDIDASLVEIHSEHKMSAAPTFKGGYGFHPMFCFADATGEALASLLRPGNAGANTVADHVGVLDDAVVQLPDEIALGHRRGDDPALVQTRGGRAGRLGRVHRRLPRCVLGSATSASSSPCAPMPRSPGPSWPPPASRMSGRRPSPKTASRAQGAAVCEVTSLISDPKLPEGTRCIIRREPLHPGAQRSLFPALDYRYWGFYTDRDGDPVALDATMRAHAHVEQHIARLKDSGLLRFPFTSFEANANWMMAVAMAADLVALVPAALPRRSLGGRPTQGASLGHLARAGSSDPSLPTARRAHHRRLARH